MQIRELDPSNDADDLASALPAAQQWRRDYLPGFAEFGGARLRLWCSDGYRQQTVTLGAFADERATEALGLVLFDFELDKNLDQAEFGLNIPAGPGALEIETVLFDEAIRRTVELGRKRLVTGMPDTMDPAAFALRHGGAKHTDVAISSVLDLAGIDRAQYAAWAEPSAKNSQYTLVRWIGPCPDELAESYCAALDAMSDQPIGTFEYEWAKNDVERLRYNEENVRRVGGRKYAQVALDPEGKVAGFNLLMSFPDEPGFIEIWDTGVAREHRGHGLGLRLKAAASLWVLEDQPDTRWVRTFNNNENEWMLAVNRTMGYQATLDYLGFEFAVGG
jgi:GNAT superfamily N-acetyltransferase